MSGRRIAPAVAGTWYPDDPATLERTVHGLLGRTPPQATRPRAVVAPHAGFAYSGSVAASALASLRGPAEAPVVLLGPSHHVALGGAVVPAAEALSTPLGEIPIDAATRGVAEAPDVRVDDRPFLPEHSLEAELPFLQCASGASLRVVPVLVGVGGAPDAEAARAALRRIADALRPLWRDGAPFVVSSDFTHYGPRFGFVPFPSGPAAAVGIERLDRGAVDRIAAGDASGFADYCDRTGATICGRDAIEVALRLVADDARPAEDDALLAYDTSGRITGDGTHSVSYAAVRLA